MSDYSDEREKHSNDRVKSSRNDRSEYRNSRHKHKFHDSDHGISRVGGHEHRRGREIIKERDDRFRDHDNRSSRDEKRRETHSDCYAGRENYRHHGRERRHSGKRQSPSRERSRRRSRSPSRSPVRSKSNRTSGFDMAPSLAAAGPNGQVSDQLPTFSQSSTDLFQNMFAMGSFQLGSLPLMPVQAMSQQATRHARRVYVGGLPPAANEQHLFIDTAGPNRSQVDRTIATFFSQVMATIGGTSPGPGDAVVNVYINHEKKFAFVEMRTVEEASNAMTLDGIMFEGVSVRVRRPTDYNPVLAAALGPSQPNPHLNLAAIGLMPGALTGGEQPDRIFVGGIPYYFSEVQMRELLESFGPLKGFDLVKDRDTGNSKGYGFCIYQDSAVTDVACEALNGVKMGDKTLTVRRATASSMLAKPEQESVLIQAQQHIAMQKMALQTAGLNFPGAPEASMENPTKILCLTQVVTPDELTDDNEYEEILEDMREECGKFGVLVNVIIPRPNVNVEQIPGVGKVFLEYSDSAGCARAKSMLGGRKFGGNAVSATYYPEDKYYGADYSA